MRVPATLPESKRAERAPTSARLRARARRLAVGIAVAGLTSACATSGKPGATPPPVIGDNRLCVGGPDDPKGERDPKCAPTPTHEPVELVNHLAGCRAGLRGPAELRLGDQLLATLRPGERKAFSLPRGDIELTILQDGRSETRALSLAGSGPVLVELGCSPQTFSGGGLQPLMLEGPHGTCTKAPAASGEHAPIKVRAGGLDLEVGPNQVQTLFLPRGSHIVKVAGVDRTIELGEGGARVPLSDCGTSGP